MEIKIRLWLSQFQFDYRYPVNKQPKGTQRSNHGNVRESSEDFDAHGIFIFLECHEPMFRVVLYAVVTTAYNVAKCVAKLCIFYAFMRMFIYLDDYIFQFLK